MRAPLHLPLVPRNGCGLPFLAPAPFLLFTLSLHDALPICPGLLIRDVPAGSASDDLLCHPARLEPQPTQEGHGLRSEEHTSELQSQSKLVCRLLLEKKNACVRPGRAPERSLPLDMTSLLLH